MKTGLFRMQFAIILFASINSFAAAPEILKLEPPNWWANQAIWLNPTYDNTNQPDMKEVYDGQPTTGYHGYGAINFYGVDEHLGDVKKFRYGDEIAMRGGNDPNNRRDFSGGWNSDSHNAFEASGRTAEENEVFEYLKKLLKLRKADSGLRNGQSVEPLFISDHAYVCRLNPKGDYSSDGVIVVALNNNIRPVTIEFARNKEVWNNEKNLLGNTTDLIM